MGSGVSPRHSKRASRSVMTSEAESPQMNVLNSFFGKGELSLIKERPSGECRELRCGPELVSPSRVKVGVACHVFRPSCRFKAHWIY